jgi:hypothetical protein
MYAADRLTVKTRKRVSALAASFNAVMRRAGIVEACPKLNSLEKLKAKDNPEYKPLRFDPNEIMRLYLAMVDAAQFTEWMAEQSGAPYSKIRRFKYSAARMESLFKRAPIPADISEADRQRQFATRARAWRRRWAKVHAVQRHLHLGFIIHEKGVATAEKKEAGHFTDHLTDVLAHTARRAGELSGEPVGRYNRAADEALKHFRETIAPYAPEWNAESADAKAGKATVQASGEAKKKETDKWRPIRNNLKQCVRAARQLVREDGLSESEAFARRQELHALIETEWTDAPEPADPPEKKTERATAAAAVSPLPPVTNTADTAKNRPALSLVSDASGDDLDRTNLSYLNSEKIANCTAKSQVSSDAGTEKPRPPLQVAHAAADAWQSIGADTFLVVKYDETKPRGAPQESERVTAAAFRKNLPRYLAVNEARPVSIMVRPMWMENERRVIHLDECSPADLERLAPFCCLQELTSDANGQGFIALSGEMEKDAFDALCKRFFKKQNPSSDKNGINHGSSGSTRWPGTLNKKPVRQRTDGSFPRVELVRLAPGLLVSPEEMDRAGLLAPEEQPVVQASAPRFHSSKLPTHWPDFNDYLSRKWLAGENRPDRSSAEAAWSCAALRMGWPASMVEDELRRLSLKAQGRRDNYVEKTVRHAAEWLSTQPQTSHAGARQRMVI